MTVQANQLFLEKISFVSKSALCPLPEPWPTLKQLRFHDYLILRAQRFLDYTDMTNHRPVGEYILKKVGHSFLQPFDSSRFWPADNDHMRELKIKSLIAIQKISQKFGNRLPTVVLDTLASLTTRPDPTRQTTIFSVREYLPYEWWLCDAVLHGLGKVFILCQWIQGELSRETGGYIFNHNCDCNHSLFDMPNCGRDLSFDFPESEMEEATGALFTHFLTETYVIGILGLPTVYNLSPEGDELVREARQSGMLI